MTRCPILVLACLAGLVASVPVHGQDHFLFPVDPGNQKWFSD